MFFKSLIDKEIFIDEMLRYLGFALIDTVWVKWMEDIKGNKLAMNW